MAHSSTKSPSKKKKVAKEQPIPVTPYVSHAAAVKIRTAKPPQVKKKVAKEEKRKR